MVMFFPETADRTPRYGISSSEVGKFNVRNYKVHPKSYNYYCNNKVAQMAKEMGDCQTWTRPNQGQSWQLAPQGACPIKEREAQCLNRRCCKCENLYEQQQEVVQWVCGQRREPEFLEDHVRYYHPHLAPKVQVLPRRTEGRQVRSAGGCGVGRQARRRGFTPRKLRSRGASPVHNCGVGSKPMPILPATQRYGYYRYYGAGGQGAKTSGDYSAGH